MLGIGAIIGVGLFSSIGDMTRGTTWPDGSVKTLGAGPGIMLAYLVTATACGFAALCYAEFAAMVFNSRPAARTSRSMTASCDTILTSAGT